MEEHRKFLADRLLSDEQPITYRLLSRALDVHVNTAKEMLFDFLHYQNGIKEDSVHATYLLYGQRRSQETQPDGDVEMGSSQPEHEAATDEVTTETLTLVAEESLKAILAEYENVTSINVYSLAPHPQKDLSLLSDISRSVAEYSVKENPLEAARKYGTITNPNVRRRDRSGKPKLAAPSASKPVKTEAPAAKSVKQEPTPSAAPASNPMQAAKIKEEVTEPTSKGSTPASSAGKPTPSLRRGGSGGIMQSFAKAANKPKPAPKKQVEEDTSMALSDDGEADDADLPATKKKTQEEAESLRKAKKDREEELRRMMEEDDEEDEEKEKEEEDEEMDDAPEEEPEPEPVEEEKKKPEEPAEVVASSGDGRRRGKRRVTKKKRILDDQGYMVTINEEGWESFSEDDKPPPAKKQTPNPTPSSSAAKAKKPAGKPGQGNIMSFFGKK